MTAKIAVTDLPEYLTFATKHGNSVLITGESGIGKTEMSGSWAMGYLGNAIDCRATQMGDADVRGVPYREGLLSRWAIPDFLPRAERDGETGAFIMDEILDQTMTSVMASFQQLFHEKRLGDYRFPEGWIIIGIGNKREHGGINRGLSYALQDRFSHYEVEIDPKGLEKYFIKIGVDPMVTSFLHLHGSYMHMRPEKGDGNWAWPTPRSWEKVSNTRKLNPPDHLKFNLYAADVGEAAAVAFRSHEKVASEVPDPDDCIKNPSKARVPESPSAMYAISCSLAFHATPENYESILKYMGRLPTEYATVVVKESSQNKPELTDTKAFTDWATKNTDILLG